MRTDAPRKNSFPFFWTLYIQNALFFSSAIVFGPNTQPIVLIKTISVSVTAAQVVDPVIYIRSFPVPSVDKIPDAKP